MIAEAQNRPAFVWLSRSFFPALGRAEEFLLLIQATGWLLASPLTLLSHHEMKPCSGSAHCRRTQSYSGPNGSFMKAIRVGGGGNRIAFRERKENIIRQATIPSIVLLIILLGSAGCIMERAPGALTTVASIEASIKVGALGADFAERARKTDNLYVMELKDTGIPYPVFTFSDYQAGYSVLVEGDRLVLLCAGFGGGYAGNFAIREEGERQVLTYQFSVGSGMSYTLSGQYVLGTGTATWQNWPDLPSPPVDP